jgi:hypothetical protein
MYADDASVFNIGQDTNQLQETTTDNTGLVEQYFETTFKSNQNTKVGREDIFKPSIGNESLNEISNDNGVRVVNFDTSKNLIVKSMIFPHCNTDKFTWTTPERKIHNQSDHILIGRGWHSSILDVQSFRAADGDTDHYLVWQKLGKDWL